LVSPAPSSSGQLIGGQPSVKIDAKSKIFRRENDKNIPLSNLNDKNIPIQT
jgi:hypothetical protein